MAFVEELVLLHKEVTPGFVLVFLAVTAQRAATVIEIRTLSLEKLELRRHHSNEFVVDVKSQLTVLS